MADKLREAAKAVGDARDILFFFRYMSVHDKVYLRLEDASNAIKAALAEQTVQKSLTVAEQEPVACIKTNGELMWLKKPSTIYSKPRPLYTAPPRKEWVGLTHDERVLVTEFAMDDIDVVIRAEAKLREKNGL